MIGSKNNMSMKQPVMCDLETMHEVLPPKNARNRPAYLRQRTHYLEFYQQRNAMVDLTESRARSNPTFPTFAEKSPC
jgi:hypothetical protein